MNYCLHWLEVEGGYICSQLSASEGIVLGVSELAGPFTAGFGLVLVSAAAGAAVGLIIKFVKT